MLGIHLSLFFSTSWADQDLFHHCLVIVGKVGSLWWHQGLAMLCLRWCTFMLSWVCSRHIWNSFDVLPDHADRPWFLRSHSLILLKADFAVFQSLNLMLHSLLPFSKAFGSTKSFALSNDTPLFLLSLPQADFSIIFIQIDILVVLRVDMATLLCVYWITLSTWEIHVVELLFAGIAPSWTLVWADNIWWTSSKYSAVSCFVDSFIAV